ncbi:glycine cleavage system aminomethyltransferase GcvT [Halorubrum sp. DTA98]|uniref:glycine cleavage system aminomethyltransferase GcvT n=1 Tax=Halorubrum sp. DTA98 TaxID=3402163 RepID=UPI003AAFF6F9
MADRLPPLYDVHEERGAKFTGFGGWEMPVEFDSISEEHAAVREAVGIFDVSHMSEIEVAGPDATTLMNRLTTNDVGALAPGDAQYAAITTEEGIMVDDVIVYRLPDGIEAGTAADALADMDDDLDAGAGDPAYLFVPNAGHNEETHDRWVDYRDEHDLAADVIDTTADWAMVAVQGPDAADALDDAVTNGDVSGLPSFDATVAAVDGVASWVARTGYTGEDGFELLCPVGDAETVWSAFDDAQPCGLGARDTLRMEMGFLLSGQDFDPDEEPRTPYEAGIGFAVDLDTAFVGRDALARAKSAGITETFIGVKLLERGVPRGGYAVTDGDLTRVGHLTSGTMSPSLNEPIGLGYLHESYAADGTEVSVVVRGDEKRAEVVTPPFIDR